MVAPASVDARSAVVMSDLELQQFSVVWTVPFTHTNHSISHYNVIVNNLNQSQSYEMSISAGPKTESVVQVTLPFPPNTTSCEILSISVTAVSGISPSNTLSIMAFIPQGLVQ